LRGSGLRNALVTVTRYFGGTKLGTGPLARAYAGACRKALEITPRAVFRQEKKYRVRAPYDCFEALKRVFEDSGCRVENEVFTEEASLEVFIAEGEEGRVLTAAGNILRGRGEIC
jgi:putative IMPACT (imprinted ancient) family translation regulator